MKTFLTEKDGFMGPRIEADTFWHAEHLARKLGVELIGEHVLTISRKDFTGDDADRICKALSESVEI